MSTFPSITRTEIFKFPFPYKLWIVVNLELDFLQWNRDGTVILLDLVALEEYLNSSISIFSMKNRSEFLTQLHEFQFQRLNATPEADEDVLLQYKNENFQRHRLDLLAKIRRNTYQLMDAVSASIANHQKNQLKAKSIGIVGARIRNNTRLTKFATNLAMERMKGDLCFRSHGALSDVQISRYRFQIILSCQHESRVLKEKLRMLDEKSASQRQLSDANVAAILNSTDPLLEFLADQYENPHDSAMKLHQHTRSEYAGYYGKCSREQLQNFFCDYLPMYEEGTTGMKQISTESAMSRNTEILRNTLNTTQENLTIKPMQAFVSSTAKTNRSFTDTDLHFSSSLEPIYCIEEENDNTNNNNKNNDSNSAIQTAKYQESDAEPMIACCSRATEADNSSNEESEDEMPDDFIMHIPDPCEYTENDDNFRNFFCPYRASLNLLYERN